MLWIDVVTKYSHGFACIGNYGNVDQWGPVSTLEFKQAELKFTLTLKWVASKGPCEHGSQIAAYSPSFELDTDHTAMSPAAGDGLRLRPKGRPEIILYPHDNVGLVRSRDALEALYPHDQHQPATAD
jgi:hypothetical protein